MYGFEKYKLTSETYMWVFIWVNVPCRLTSETQKKETRDSPVMYPKSWADLTFLFSLFSW